MCCIICASDPRFIQKLCDPKGPKSIIYNNGKYGKILYELYFNIEQINQKSISPIKCLDSVKLVVFRRRQNKNTSEDIWKWTLRKHDYSNILKILPSKTEHFQIKTGVYIIFSYFCSKHTLWVLVRTASTILMCTDDLCF